MHLPLPIIRLIVLKPVFYTFLITCVHIPKLLSYREPVSSQAGSSEKLKKKDTLKILAVFFQDWMYSPAYLHAWCFN